MVAVGSAPPRGGDFCIACGTGLPAGPSEGPRAGVGAALRTAVDLLARHQPEQALVALREICAHHRDHAVARAYLGVAYLRLGHVSDARAELEEAVRMAPHSFICRTKYAEFLARVGFYDQAMSQIDLGLERPAPDAESRHAALELRQFCKDKAQGLHYRELAYPKLQLGSIIPRRKVRHGATATPERG